MPKVVYKILSTYKLLKFGVPSQKICATDKSMREYYIINTLHNNPSYVACHFLPEIGLKNDSEVSNCSKVESIGDPFVY